jgi:hypothetical protein
MAEAAKDVKTKPKMNGNLQKLLAYVGGVVTAAAIIGLVGHFLNNEIHQEKEVKKNQAQVWFQEWFRRDIQPEFNEIKGMLRDHTNNGHGPQPLDGG